MGNEPGHRFRPLVKIPINHQVIRAASAMGCEGNHRVRRSWFQRGFGREDEIARTGRLELTFCLGTNGTNLSPTKVDVQALFASRWVSRPLCLQTQGLTSRPQPACNPGQPAVAARTLWRRSTCTHGPRKRFPTATQVIVDRQCLDCLLKSMKKNTIFDW